MAESSAAPPPAAALAPRPVVVVLATGGTIAGAAAEGSPHRYRAGAVPAAALLARLPGAADLAPLEVEEVAAIGSQDMGEAVWRRLVPRLRQALARPEVAGVVVTHGTDTLEETAFFLHCVLQTEKPVVLVGAMRAPSAPDADGPANLAAAIAVAGDRAARGRGILVVHAGVIFSARHLAKVHTTRLAAFASPGAEPLGHVQGPAVTFAGPARARAGAPFPGVLSAAPAFPRVDILFGHAGMDGALLEAAVAAGARGVVLAGVGAGNLAAPALAAAAAAAGRGIAIVRASRVPEGEVARNIEVADDRLGLIASRDLPPAKARILLMLALAGKTPVAELQGAFDRA